MAGFEVHREDVAGKIVLRVQGTLDGAAARELHLMVGQLEPQASVVLDFSQVREFYDYSVGVLTQTLAARTVELRGLRTHQARMFEYFGVSTGASDRAYYTPEELLSA